MKLLIDMNLSPTWVSVLKEAGLEPVHWSSIGRPDAPDNEILGYARSNGYVVFTHDLDFGTILAATKANCPSVIQIRSKTWLPNTSAGLWFQRFTSSRSTSKQVLWSPLTKRSCESVFFLCKRKRADPTLFTNQPSPLFFETGIGVTS